MSKNKKWKFTPKGVWSIISNTNMIKKNLFLSPVIAKVGADKLKI